MKRILTIIFLFITLTTLAQKLEFSETTLNFGTIPMKPKSEKTLTLYNNSDKPIVIKTISIDCNCIKTEWKKSPVMIGDSCVIKVIYTPSETGVFYKKAKIITTAGDHEIIIRGSVK